MHSANMPIGGLSVLGVVFLFIPAMVPTHVFAQENYTVGNGTNAHHCAVAYCPFAWEGTDVYAEETYFAYTYGCMSDTSGQMYDPIQFLEYDPPPEYGGVLTVYHFLEMIQDPYDELGVLYIATHGVVLQFVIETYEYSSMGLAWRDSYYDDYVDTDGAGPDDGDFSQYEVVKGRVENVAHTISVRSPFIRNRGDLGEAFVYVSACSSYNLSYTFTSCGARASVGYNAKLQKSQTREAIHSVFRRLDGQECQFYRKLMSAVTGVNNLTISGAQNTTLAPSVISTSVPSPVNVGDTIRIFLDTKCDDFILPSVMCSWGWLEDRQWIDSNTIQAIYRASSPGSFDDVTFTLGYNSVVSAMNPAMLDGNTYPWYEDNAHGPAHDDYEWTVPLSICDCGEQYGTDPNAVGDINCDGTTDPTDVQVLVQFAYKQQDARCDKPLCPYETGDVNCDGGVNPTDVGFLIQFVYNTNDALCDPCT